MHSISWRILINDLMFDLAQVGKQLHGLILISVSGYINPFMVAEQCSNCS